MADQRAHGTLVRGTRVTRSRLTDKDVYDLLRRQMRGEKIDIGEEAAKRQMSYQSMWNMLKRKTWRRIDPSSEWQNDASTPAHSHIPDEPKAADGVVAPMHNDEIRRLNACTALLTSTKYEAFPLHVLGSKRPGEWIQVREFCLQIGVPPGDVGPTVFATWLPDPLANEAYAVIVFYDDESKWSTAAQYNRARLRESAAPEHFPQATG